MDEQHNVESESLTDALDGLSDTPYIQEEAPPDVQQDSSPEGQADERVGFGDPNHPEHARFQELRDNEEKWKSEASKHEATMREEAARAARAEQELAFYKMQSEQLAQRNAQPQTKQEIDSVEGFQDWVKNEIGSVAQQQQAALMNLMEANARTTHKDYDEVTRAAKPTPAMAQMILASPNPPEMLYQLGLAALAPERIRTATEKANAEASTSIKEKSRTPIASAQRQIPQTKPDRKSVLEKIRKGELPTDAIEDFLSDSPFMED